MYGAGWGGGGVNMYEAGWGGGGVNMYRARGRGWSECVWSWVGGCTEATVCTCVHVSYTECSLYVYS